MLAIKSRNTKIELVEDTSLIQREIIRVYQKNWISEILKTLWSATVQSVRLSTWELIIRISAMNDDLLVGN